MTTVTSLLPGEESLKKLEAFVRQHPQGNFFQSPVGFRFFSGVKHYTPMLSIAYEAGKITGSLLAVTIKEGSGPKGYFSRRCIVYGGPLVREELAAGRAVVEALLRQLNEKSRSIYTEFRNGFDLGPYQSAFEHSGYTYEPHLNYIVPVADSREKSLMLLSSSKRRQVRKSLKNGAQIRPAQSLKEVKAFYRILKDLYANKVKKPLPDYSFFKHFFELGGTGKYLLVFHDGEMVGGIMCPIYKETIYEWYIAGLDGQIAGVYPSVMATWAAIEYASEHGLKYFDFMGAGKPEDDYGVRDFKSKFGGNLLAHGRFVRVNQPLLYSAGKTGLKLLQKLT